MTAQHSPSPVHGRPDPSEPHPALDPSSPAPVPDTSRIHPAAHEVVRAEVSDRPADSSEHARWVERSTAGAVVTFAGLVRDHDGGRSVEFIEYVAHPSAAAVIAEVAADIARTHDIDALAVTHRIGELRIGDNALAVAVAAAHRAEAFTAASLLVDEVKRRLPVWKRQVFTDGSHEWVACP